MFDIVSRCLTEEHLIRYEYNGSKQYRSKPMSDSELIAKFNEREKQRELRGEKRLKKEYMEVPVAAPPSEKK